MRRLRFTMRSPCGSITTMARAVLVTAPRSIACIATLLLGVLFACRDRPPPVGPSPNEPAPAPAPAAFGGVWQGEYRLISCEGDRGCASFIGSRRPFTLRLEQMDGTASGLFATNAFLAPVTGSVDLSGRLLLTGSAPAASQHDYTGGVEIRELALRRNSDGSLAGTLAYAIRPTEFVPGPGVISYEAEIGSASYSTLPPDSASFEGTWAGWYVVRACTPTGWNLCYWRQPDELIELQVVLTQSGDVVAGEMIFSNDADLPVRVSGRVIDGRLTLDGIGSQAVGSGRDVIRLTRWISQRNAIGEMTGQFSCSDEYHIEVGVEAGQIHTMVYEAELASFSLASPPPRPRVLQR